MIETSRLYITEAALQDIDEIITLESHPDNRDYLWIGTKDEHRAEIEDPNHLLLIFKSKESEEIIGYALVRLDYASRWFELRRIAIAVKNAGYGRESVLALFNHAFITLELNKVWLDVYPHNTIGIKLYESLGMHLDGILRENYYSSEFGFLDQKIYSMLRSEYLSD